jgi:hypothetical protein
VASIYQQFDGYIGGVGHDLANFLKDKTIVNGIGMDQSMATGHANGMGCLAAQYIAQGKERIGGFYMTSPGDEQAYNYEVRLVDGELRIKVDNFEGTPQELLEYNESDEEE